MPTRSELEKWDTGKLTAWAAELDTAIGTYETQLGRMVGQFTETNWAGATRDAAYDRFSEENTEGRKLSEEIRSVTTALRSAESRLANERRILLGKVTDAENDAGSPLPLQVSDRFEVQTKQAVLRGNITREDLQRVKERVDHHQGLINAAYYGLSGAISEMSTAITTAAEQVRTRGDLIGNSIDAPVTAADTGKLGAEDGKAVHDAITNPDGSIDKAKLDEIASHLPQGMLNEQDLQALAEGKDVSTVPASTQQYYREFYQSAGKDGLLALSDHLKDQEQAGNPLAAGRRDALANGLMVVSNEKIGTGRNPDGSLQSPGGYKQLSEDVRQLVSTRVGGPDSNATRFPGSENDAAAQHRFYQDSQRFGELVTQANPGYEPGTELSRELTRQSASLGVGAGMPGSPQMPGGPDKDATEGIMRNYLEISSRNHEATTQLLTGETEPGSPPLEQGYDPKKVIQPLLQFDWEDSDGKQPPQLFNWIGEDAVPHPGTDGHPAVTPEQSQLASRAASGLAGILTSDAGGKDGQMGPFEALMNMPGHDNQSLGQVNPGLTRQLTGAMIPYIDNIAGAPGNPTPDFHLRDGNVEDRDLQAVRLSTLFNTDQVSSGAWNAAMISRTNDYAAQYALLSDQPSNDRNQYAEAAGRLMAYQEQGLRAEAFDRGLDDKEAAEDTAGRKKLYVDLAAGALSTAAGDKFNPLADIAVDSTGKIISDQIKPEYTGTPEVQQKVVQDELQAQQYYSMLRAVSSDDPGFFTSPPPRAGDFPSKWLENGTLRSYEDIVGTPGTDREFHASRNFQSTANSWLNGAGVDTPGFISPNNQQRLNIGDYTKSPDEYKSTVLKGH